MQEEGLEFALGKYYVELCIIVTYKLRIKLECFITLQRRLGTYKNSNLLDPFLSYDEIKVLRIRPLGPFTQNFIFCITYDKTNKLDSFFLAMTFQASITKHFSSLGPFLSYKENKVL